MLCYIPNLDLMLHVHVYPMPPLSFFFLYVSGIAAITARYLLILTPSSCSTFSSFIIAPAEPTCRLALFILHRPRRHEKAWNGVVSTLCPFSQVEMS